MTKKKLRKDKHIIVKNSNKNHVEVHIHEKKTRRRRTKKQEKHETRPTINNTAYNPRGGISYYNPNTAPINVGGTNKTGYDLNSFVQPQNEILRLTDGATTIQRDLHSPRAINPLISGGASSTSLNSSMSARAIKPIRLSTSKVGKAKKRTAFVYDKDNLNSIKTISTLRKKITEFYGDSITEEQKAGIKAITERNKARAIDLFLNHAGIISIPQPPTSPQPTPPKEPRPENQQRYTEERQRAVSFRQPEEEEQDISPILHATQHEEMHSQGLYSEMSYHSGFTIPHHLQSYRFDTAHPNVYESTSGFYHPQQHSAAQAIQEEEDSDSDDDHENQFLISSPLRALTPSRHTQIVQPPLPVIVQRPGPFPSVDFREEEKKADESISSKPVVRGRGRPAGAKNKAKPIEPVVESTKPRPKGATVNDFVFEGIGNPKSKSYLDKSQKSPIRKQGVEQGGQKAWR